MKMKCFILIILTLLMSSCCAQQASRKKEIASITNELSFIGNRRIRFSIKKVACDSCFPIIDIGYRVRIKLSPKQDSLITKIKKKEWILLLNDSTTDYAANILLYYLHNRDAIVLLYNRNIVAWRNGMKDDDILYWKKTLK